MKLPVADSVEVSIAKQANLELVDALRRLIPQLSTAVPPDLEALAETLADPSNTLLVASDRAEPGRIVGTLTLVTYRTPTGVRARIEDVVVDSSARRRGVAEALTRTALRIAKERGARSVDLTSNPSRQAAHRLYEKAGFVVRDTTVYRYAWPDEPD